MGVLTDPRPGCRVATFRRLAAVACLAGCAAGGGAQLEAESGAGGQLARLLARAAAVELDTPYVAPPGDALSHHISGFAKTLCSAVFVTGLDPDFAAANVGFFSGPYAYRRQVTRRVVDRDRQRVHLTLPDGVVRTAKRNGDHGCVTLPVGQEDVFFDPIDIRSALPDPAATSWPLGDLLPSGPLPDGIDAGKVRQAVDTAFEPAEALTAAVVITHKGRIIGERYGPGITMHTPLESWSMGKSVTATLMGVLIQQGVYELFQPAPVPEWQAPGDPRRQIRIADLLRMSSGLRFRGVGRPRLRPGARVSRSPVCIHGLGERVRLGGDAPPPVAAEHRWALPQLRPGPDELLDPPGRGRPRRRISVISPTRTVRSDRHPRHGARDRPLRQLPAAGVRARAGPRLGAAGPTCTCRTGSGTVSGSCRRDSSSSSAASPPPGRRMVGRSTAVSSGSTAMAGSRFRATRTTCREPAASKR